MSCLTVEHAAGERGNDVVGHRHRLGHEAEDAAHPLVFRGLLPVLQRQQEQREQLGCQQHHVVVVARELVAELGDEVLSRGQVGITHERLGERCGGLCAPCGATWRAPRATPIQTVLEDPTCHGKNRFLRCRAVDRTELPSSPDEVFAAGASGASHDRVAAPSAPCREKRRPRSELGYRRNNNRRLATQWFVARIGALIAGRNPTLQFAESSRHVSPLLAHISSPALAVAPLARERIVGDLGELTWVLLTTSWALLTTSCYTKRTALGWRAPCHSRTSNSELRGVPGGLGGATSAVGASADDQMLDLQHAGRAAHG
jgi:hypothetical protein